MHLADHHALTFQIDCVTDARKMLVLLKNADMKNPADTNCIGHLFCLKNIMETLYLIQSYGVTRVT